MSEPPTSRPAALPPPSPDAAQRHRRRRLAPQLRDQRRERLGIDVAAAVEHRPVKAHQSGAAPLPQQQRRDVAVAHQRLRGGAHALGVQGRDDAIAAVAAARADDPVDAVVRDELHELADAARVVARQVAAPVEQIVAAQRLEARPPEQRLAGGELLGVDGPTGRGDAERGTRCERARFDQARHLEDVILRFEEIVVTPAHGACRRTRSPAARRRRPCVVSRSWKTAYRSSKVQVDGPGRARCAAWR